MIKVAIKSAAIVVLSALAFTGAATAKDSLPDVTEDGLKRIESKKVDAVYWQEGASLKPYTQVMLDDCSVAFEKNWMRDYNRDQMGLDGRVRTSDMDRIKKSLSALFNEEFTKVLEKGGYEVVQSPGAEVLQLRPAIINLDVTAPDLMTAGMSRTYTTSAGSMTLSMELYDSDTGSKIGQVLDRQNARDDGRISFSNSVTNRAEANRIVSKWAGLLVSALDEAKASQVE